MRGRRSIPRNTWPPSCVYTQVRAAVWVRVRVRVRVGVRVRVRAGGLGYQVIVAAVVVVGDLDGG